MNRILYHNRCRCKEKFSITKKPNLTIKGTRRRVGKKLLEYPKPNETRSKTFQMRYDKKLSPIAKVILNSFHNKYIYHAIDDILDSFKSNSIERDNLLAIIYSPIISLQNNFSINFFDIWIDEIYINEVSKVNKFLNHDSSNFEQFSYITIKLFYKMRLPIKKQDPLW